MFRSKSLFFIGFLLLISAACAQRGPLSQEEKSTVAELRSQISTLDTQIQEARIKDEQLAGGLVKSLIAVRLEILGINHALIMQRIQSIESGASISISVPGTKIDLDLAKQLEAEIAIQEAKLIQAETEAAGYSGGLVGAFKQSTIATQENSLAMLRQRWLIAKFGLSFPQSAATSTLPSEAPKLATRDSKNRASQDDKLVTIQLLRKKFAKQKYEDYIFFDVQYTAVGLTKPARAIKGRLLLKDLFGEVKMTIGWTIDSGLTPGQIATENGTGFEYNQFMDEHQWVNATPLENMTADFEISSILYSDGTREDF